ncbi:MAG TPA: hypothetical protein VLY03_06920 [Bacteroidota bacterium]|nr:hypothetical protein [Bacteroidota bacterium]
MTTSRFSRTDQVAAGFFFGLAVLFCFRQIYDPDIGFHLRAGNWMIDNLQFPAKDPFTYTAGSNSYIDIYWIYQVSVALVNRLLAELGIIILHAVLICTTFYILLKRVYRKVSLKEIPYWQWIFLIGLLAPAFQFIPRPHVFSWLYLALILFALEDYLERGIDRLALLPVVMVLWVNTHTSFILGWIVIASALAGLMLRERTWWTPLSKFAILSVVICLVNPYFLRGIGLPFYQFQFLQSANAFKSTISEYASPLSLDGYNVHGKFLLLQPLFPFHVLLVVSAVGFARNLRKVQFHELVIFGIFLYLALTGIKNIGYFVVATLPTTIVSFRRETLPAVQRVLNGLATGAAALFAIALITNSYYISYRSDERFGYRFSNFSLPVGAANFLREHDLRGKILNHFNFGGYLMFTLPQKIFIDGRNEVMGEEFFREYYLTWNAINKSPLLEKYHPEIVVFPYEDDFLWVHYFKQHRTAWRLVFVDELSAIYLRDGYARSIPEVDSTSVVAQLADLPGNNPDSVLNQPDPAGTSLVSFHPRYFPRKEIGLSTFCYYNDWFQSAITIGVEAVSRATEPCPELYYNLGHYYFEAHDYRRSAYCYTRFLKTNSDQLAAERLKAIQSGHLPQPKI